MFSVPTAVTKVLSTLTACQALPPFQYRQIQETFASHSHFLEPGCSLTHVQLHLGACVSHWAWVHYSLLSNTSGIRSSGAHVSVVTVSMMLNTAGLPGNLPSPPSLSLIYLASFRQGSGTGCSCFGVVLLPLGEQADKLSKKMGFILCGKVSIYGGEKNVLYIPSTWWIWDSWGDKPKIPMKRLWFVRFISTGDSQSCLFEINNIKGDPLPTLWCGAT